MCGIAGIYGKVQNLDNKLRLMNKIQQHRGVDGEEYFIKENIGFAHRRLSIIDLETGDQPMTDIFDNTICYNGEIYNYIELKKELKEYPFRTTSDTEVILAAYWKWGKQCVTHLRGMFAFAIWDENDKILFCARDRVGIKPFYYTIIKGNFYFASEVKALLPFIKVSIDEESLETYQVLQLQLNGNTLFKNINELQPATTLILKDNKIKIWKYWEVYYNLDFDHTEKYFEEKLYSLIEDSVKIHLRSDVGIGVYLSGGIDSGIVSVMASKIKDLDTFHGRFDNGDLYDESKYAKEISHINGNTLREYTITPQDFIDDIRKVIYHLDYPVAGIGSFAQFEIAKCASKYRKVMLSGCGGDEIFGGYTRYLIAYFEQVIKGAIDGTLHNGNFIVTYESIIPNLVYLENYKPMLKKFFSKGFFDKPDKRYYDLINRGDKHSESTFNKFSKIFNSDNTSNYFDRMTHFDFKTLLPALLHVEDRMSMANGIETRVPLIDTEIIDFAATIPSNIKFKNGRLKNILINSMRNELPESVINRKNKMGFPVPFNIWMSNEINEFVIDILQSAKKRGIRLGINDSDFSRKIWGIISLELWYQEFYDKQKKYNNE